jgi:hypothetical protein
MFINKISTTFGDNWSDSFNGGLSKSNNNVCTLILCLSLVFFVYFNKIRIKTNSISLYFTYLMILNTFWNNKDIISWLSSSSKHNWNVLTHSRFFSNRKC